MGQPDPGAGLKGDWGVGLEGYLLLQQPSPQPYLHLGALAFPGASLGLQFRLCVEQHSALVSLCPLPLTYN